MWFPVFLGNAPWPVHFPSGRLAIFSAVFDELTASAAEYFFAANPTVAAAVVAEAVLFLRHMPFVNYDPSLKLTLGQQLVAKMIRNRVGIE